MRRIVLWLLSTLTVVVLLFGYHTSTAGPLRAESSRVAPVTDGGSSDSGAEPSTTVDGDVAQTEWGPVQVRLVIEGGAITDVGMLQYPASNPKDVEINQYALPILIQETVESQGAQVDMVSGATVTSVGYLESLQSALDKAGL